MEEESATILANKRKAKLKGETPPRRRLRNPQATQFI
jgi:hypothetical protein